MGTGPLISGWDHRHEDLEFKCPSLDDLSCRKIWDAETREGSRHNDDDRKLDVSSGQYLRRVPPSDENYQVLLGNHREPDPLRRGCKAKSDGPGTGANPASFNKAKEIKRALRAFPWSSAAGISGLTPEHLRQ